MRGTTGHRAGTPGLYERVLGLLSHERSLHGHGKAGVIDHRLGKSEGYVGRLLRGEIGLQVDMLEQILEAMEVDRADFFARAVGHRLIPTRVLRRIERATPKSGRRPLIDSVLLARLEQWVAGQMPGRAGGEVPPGEDESPRRSGNPVLLEERIFSDPAAGWQLAWLQLVGLWKQARDQGLDQPRRVAMARLLGIVGSAVRLLGSARESAACLRLGLELLAPVGDSVGAATAEESELLRRSAGLLAGLGEPVVAELLLDRALRRAMLMPLGPPDRGGDAATGPLLGRILLQRGAVALGRGESGQALQHFEAGLQVFEGRRETLWPWCFTAELGRGKALFQAIEPEQHADPRPTRRTLARARAYHRTRHGPGWWSLCHLEGMLAARLGDVATAEERLREACVGLARGPWLADEILVRLDLAEILLTADRPEASAELLMAAYDWMQGFRHAPAVVGALQDIARAMLTADLEPTLLRRARKALEREGIGFGVSGPGWMS